MIPAVPPLIKFMTVILAGSIVLSPVPAPTPAPQAGKITNKITNSIIKDLHEKQKQIDNPNYKPKKKIPITGGFKHGHDPLPKGTTPAGTYRNIWESLKSDLGLK